jgi:leucyl aminopeptidase
MKVSAELNTLQKIKSDAVAVFFYSDQKLQANRARTLPQSFGKKISAVAALNNFSGKEGEVVRFFTYKEIASPRLLLVGLGKQADLTIEKIRRASASAAKTAQSLKAKSLSFEIDDQLQTDKISATEIAQAIVEGAVLSLYKFDKYFSRDENGTKIDRISVFTSNKSRLPDIRSGTSAGEILSAAVYHARNLENAPSNEIFPETLARDAQKAAREFGFKATVFDKNKIERLGMGGVIGVSKGSEKPPRFIVLEHGRRFQGRGTVCLVGKGVTFDTGGISIKPAASMSEMKMDMSGGAAVIGTFQALGALGLPVHVVGLIPTVENMPSGTAVKPGDIIRHYNGKTSEVDNTDAEGRLILADALGYASKFKPEVVIDLATLTGACVVALGHYATGMMGNDDELMNELTKAGERSYERVWKLPMFDEYEKLIKSDVADVKNVGGRWAGAITAGWFLKKFIGNYKWVHLDIAGTAILEENLDYTPRGGSGVGVRLLIEFLKHWKKR